MKKALYPFALVLVGAISTFIVEHFGFYLVHSDALLLAFIFDPGLLLAFIPQIKPPSELWFWILSTLINSSYFHILFKIKRLAQKKDKA